LYVWYVGNEKDISCSSVFDAIKRFNLLQVLDVGHLLHITLLVGN